MTQDLSPAGFLHDMENGTQRTRGRGKLPILALPVAGSNSPGCRRAAGWHDCGQQQLRQMQNLSGASSSDRSGASSADPGLTVSSKCGRGYVLVGSSLKGHEQLVILSLIPFFLFVPLAPILTCALPHLPTPM